MVNILYAFEGYADTAKDRTKYKSRLKRELCGLSLKS